MMQNVKKFNVLFISNGGAKKQIIGCFNKKEAIIVSIRIASLIKHADEKEICSTAYVDIEEILDYKE
jgi:hypothetical protein